MVDDFDKKLYLRKHRSHYFWCLLDLSYSSGTAPVCLEVRWQCSSHWPCSSYGFSALFVKWGVILQHTDVKPELSTGSVPHVGHEDFSLDSYASWKSDLSFVGNKQLSLWEVLMKEPKPRLFKRGMSLQPENQVSCLSMALSSPQ